MACSRGVVCNPQSRASGFSPCPVANCVNRCGPCQKCPGVATRARTIWL